MNKEYYNKVYIPGIVKWGKIKYNDPTAQKP